MPPQPNTRVDVARTLLDRAFVYAVIMAPDDQTRFARWFNDFRRQMKKAYAAEDRRFEEVVPRAKRR